MFQISKHPVNTKADGRRMEYYKDVACASEFIESREANAMIGMADIRSATVGHVRHATAGKVKVDNAHPFIALREDGSYIVGVHNGTMDGWRGKTGADEHEVDSEWLFNAIAERGMEAFRGIDGAYALIWYDSREPDSLFVARNSKRELFFAASEDNKSLVGCSELGMLGWLAERHDLKLCMKANGRPLFMYFEPGFVYNISLKDASMTKEELPKYDSKFRDMDDLSYSVNKYPSTNLHAYRGNYTRDDWRYYDSVYGNEQGTILDGIRQAIHMVAEDSSMDMIIDSDALELNAEQALNKALQAALIEDDEDFLHSIDDPNSGDVPETEFLALPDDRASSRGEIQNAKNSGVYSVIGLWSPVMLDPDTLELWGTFEFPDSGHMETMDGIVRGVSSAEAERMTTGDRRYTAAIIGIRRTTRTDTCAILTLNVDSKRIMRAYDDAGDASATKH